MKAKTSIAAGGLVALIAGLAFARWMNPAAGDGLVGIFAATTGALGALLALFRHPEEILWLKLGDRDPTVSRDPGTESCRACKDQQSRNADTIDRAA
jgi:hypothetical protein